MSTDVSEVRAASIIRAMTEAARTSETSVDIQLRTRQYIPEDSELHTRRRENLKYHIVTGLSPWRPGFAPGSFHVGFVVDKVALGQVCLRVLWFSMLIYVGDEQ
jgi:hypothetical protein